MANTDDKPERSLSQVREVVSPPPSRPGEQQYSEKGARVVSQGNVNENKPPTSSGPVASSKSDSDKK